MARISGLLRAGVPESYRLCGQAAKRGALVLCRDIDGAA